MTQTAPKTSVCSGKAIVSKDEQLFTTPKLFTSSSEEEQTKPGLEEPVYLVKYARCEGEHVFERVYPRPWSSYKTHLYNIIDGTCPRCSVENPCLGCGQVFGPERFWCPCQGFMVFLSSKTWVEKDGRLSFQFRSELKRLIAEAKKDAHKGMY